MKALIIILFISMSVIISQEDDFFPPEEKEELGIEDDFFPADEKEELGIEDDFFPPEENDFFPPEEKENNNSEKDNGFFPPDEKENNNSEKNSEKENTNSKKDGGFFPPNEKENNNSKVDTTSQEPPPNYQIKEEEDAEEDGFYRGVGINEERGTQSIIISGNVGFNYIFREDIFADTVLGGNTTNLDGDFFDPLLRLRFDIFLSNNIEAVLELHNEVRVEQQIQTNFGNLFITNRAENQNNFEFEIERAYIRINEFLTENLQLQIGIIPKRYALRANGDAFFLDLGEAESPFDEGEDVNARGAIFTWRPSKALELYIEAFYFNTEETGFIRQDQSIVGFNVDLDLSKTVENADESVTTLVRFFNFIFSAIYGDNNQPIWTLGFGFDYFSSSQPDVYTLEVYGEGLFQIGELDRDDLNKSQAHLAFGGYLGSRYTYEKSPWRPYIDVSAWYISGDDDDVDRDKNNDLITYEDIDSTLIVEDNDYGFDIDSNYWAIKIQSGVSLKPLTSEEMRLEILYAHFEAIDVNGNGSHRIGEEIDLRLVWEYTSDLTFVLAAGLLFNSPFLEDEISGDGDQSVFMLRFETLLRF